MHNPAATVEGPGWREDVYRTNREESEKKERSGNKDEKGKETSDK